MPTIRSQEGAVTPAMIGVKVGENWVERLIVKINPDSLKVHFANQVKKVSSAGSVQYLGAGSSKLTVQLLFDVTDVAVDDQGVLNSLEALRSWMGKDIIESTDEEELVNSAMGSAGEVAGKNVKNAEGNLEAIEKAAKAIDELPSKTNQQKAEKERQKKANDAEKASAQKSKEAADKSLSDLKKANPGRKIPLVSFVWGAFTFEGIIESLEQTLELFSATGVPLRATAQLTLTRQRLQPVLTPKRASPGAGPPAGTAPLLPTPPGTTAQALGAALGGGGGGGGWQGPARALGIENPRQLPSGAWMDPRKLSGG